MSEPEPIEVTPSDIQHDVSSTLFGASCDSQYLVYNSTAVRGEVDIYGSGLPNSAVAHPVEFEPDWCSISKHGRYIAYGELIKSNATIAIRDGSDRFKIRGVMDGLFVGDELWLLRLVRKSIVIEVRQAPKWVVSQSLKIVDDSPGLYPNPQLRPTFRSSSVALQLTSFEGFLVERNSSGELSHFEMVGLLGLNTDQYFAPHGEEITAVQDSGIYRLVYPFDEIYSSLQLPTFGTKGCYLDDTHFLGMGHNGALYLVHTRSLSVVADFKIKNNVRYRLLNASRFGRDQVILTLAGIQHARQPQRYLIPIDEFLGKLC